MDFSYIIGNKVVKELTDVLFYGLLISVIFVYISVFSSFLLNISNNDRICKVETSDELVKGVPLKRILGFFSGVALIVGSIIGKMLFSVS